MAKIIDFQEAKKSLQIKSSKSNNSKNYASYAFKLNTAIYSIDRLIRNQIEEIPKCKSLEEYNLIYGKIKELQKLYDPILVKIEKSGLTDSDKIVFKKRIEDSKVADSVLAHIVTPDEIKEKQGFKVRRKTPEEFQRESNEFFRSQTDFKKSNLQKDIKKRPAKRIVRRTNIR